MPPFPTGTAITQLLLEQGQRRARLAEQLGQIAAETQARNGQIWGNTIAQLGQLPAQYLQQRQADQEMKLRQQQMQMQTEQMQQQQAARNQAAVRSAAQSSILSAYTTQNPDGSVTVNAPAIQAKMAEIAMPIEDQASMMKYVGSLNDSIKAARDQRANETGDLLNDLITHTKGPITPEGAGLTYSMWKQNGLTSSEADAQVAKLLSQVPPGTDMRDLLTQMRDLAPKYRDAKPVTVAPGAALVNPVTGQPVFQAPDRPVSVPPNGTLVRPDTGKTIYKAPAAPPPPISPYQQEELNIRRQELGLQMQKFKADQAQQAKAAQDITPGTKEYKAAEDLATGRLTFSNFRTLEAYNRNAGEKLAIYQKAAEINPNFDPAAYELGYTFAKNPKVEQQIASLNNVMSGVDDLIKTSNEAKRTGVTALNSLVNKAGYNIGGKHYSNFRLAQTAMADELSGALGYGSATDMAREMGFAMTDANLSPANFEAGLRDVVIPFVNRKKASLLGPMGIYGQADRNPGAQPSPQTGNKSFQVGGFTITPK